MNAEQSADNMLNSPYNPVPGGSFIVPESMGLGVVVLCSLVGLAIGARAVWRAGRLKRTVSLMRDARAVATIEFALVFPVLLFLILLLAQTTTLMAAGFFVQYGAFSATRAAIVQIPRTYADDPANVYTHAHGRTKHDLIHRAGYLALLPIAGRLDSAGAAEGDLIVAGLGDYYAAQDADEPAWVQSMLAQRVAYAQSNTDMTVLRPSVEEDHQVTFIPLSEGQTETFDPKDPVSVGITHRFNLAIPWIQRIYADDEHPDRPGYYTELKAVFTLTNEGIRDDLPPQPTLERVP